MVKKLCNMRFFIFCEVKWLFYLLICDKFLKFVFYYFLFFCEIVVFELVDGSNFLLIFYSFFLNDFENRMYK